MKKTILILALIISIVEMEAQNSSASQLEFSFDFSLLYWNNQDISESYSSMSLVGLGLAKLFSEDFKLFAEADFGKDEAYGTKLYYKKLEAGIRYSWTDFSYKKAIVYGGLGVLGIWINVDDSEDYSEQGNSAGFSAIIGIIIPLDDKICLDLKWNSIWSEMEIDNGNINVGSQIFSGGLLFKF